MKKPVKPEPMRNRPEPPQKPDGIEIIEFYRTPSSLEKDFGWAERSEKERLDIIKNEYDHEGEGFVVSMYGDKIAISALDLSDPKGPEELYWPDTTADHDCINLTEILKNLPNHVSLEDVTIHVDNYSYPGDSDAYIGIRATYEIATPDYDKKMKKHEKALKEYEENLKKWKDDKKKKLAENKKYKATLKEYNEWRAKRIQELEEKGEL